MVGITTEWQPDEGRVKITLSDMIEGVPHRIERTANDGDTWELVRGYNNVTSPAILIFDWEYTPNVENCYRVISPIAYDDFNRTVAPGGWGTATTGQDWTPLFDDLESFSVDDGIGVITMPAHTIAKDERIRLNQTITDIDSTITVMVPTTIPDQNFETNLAVRCSGTTEETLAAYDLTLIGIISSGNWEARIGKWDGAGNWVILTPRITITPIVPGQWMQIRLRARANVLSAKVWVWDTPEPSSWMLSVIDEDYSSGNIDVRLHQAEGVDLQPWISYWWGLSATEIGDVWPQSCVTPEQDTMWIKSVAFPSLNIPVTCVDTSARGRRSRAGIFDVIGRPEPVGVVDVGSTETFTITFVSRSLEENKQIELLLTWGQPLYLQPPGETDEECGRIAGTPSGFVIPGDSVQTHALRGSRGWYWQIPFTRVAAADYAGVVPRQMTWRVLWSMVDTWTEVWALWDTWAELWSHEVTPEQTSQAISPPGGGF